jgi:hypothetical protein
MKRKNVSVYAELIQQMAKHTSHLPSQGIDDHLVSILIAMSTSLFE